MSRRGAVLLQVLVFGVIVAFIAALLMRMTLMSQTVVARAQGSAQAMNADTGALSTLLGAWNASSVCTSVPGVYACAPAGSCGCTCTPATSGQPIVTTSLVSGQCKLSIQSQ